MNTVTQARPLQDIDAGLSSLAFVTVSARDPSAAAAFYKRLFGLEDAGSDRLPGFGAHKTLRMRSGQWLVVTAPEGPDQRKTGVHTAFRVSPAAHAAIAARLAAEKVEVLTYLEDRVKEAGENFYVLDPDGNRIQLVRSAAAISPHGVDALDHAVVLSYDMHWAEAFYGEDLKMSVESRIGVRTADHSRARRWAAGEEAMAPGTRRLDKLYMTMGGQNEVPRANMQVYFTVGDSTFGVYLATKHQQEPPEEQIVGTPRTAFITSRAGLDRLAEVLQSRHRPCTGPIEHPSSSSLAASLYCKDTSGNFLEFCVPRR